MLLAPTPGSDATDLHGQGLFAWLFPRARRPASVRRWRACMSKRNVAVGIGSLLVTILVACGGPPEPSGFGDPTDKPKANGNGSNGQLGGANDPNAGGTSDDDFKSCATAQATAEAKPVYLVFMFDKSGSMTELGSPKWASCKAATKAFFSDPQSQGISASLHYFPLGSNPDNPTCNVADYAKPAVAMRALPNGDLGASLDATTPKGGTPTEPALDGALTYASEIAQGQGKDGKVVVVLVTDGAPNNCNSDVNGVANIAKLKADTIPTYVIGVGNVANLNTIASAGGTKQAFVVPTNDPAQIKSDFQKAITEIKLSALSCDYKIPTPPDGKTLDRAKVNVLYQPTGGASQTLPYDQACASGKGWRYDDANNPTRIIVCDGSCSSIKAAPGKVDVLFGCTTKEGGVK
jgi:hypothetical protein